MSRYTIHDCQHCGIDHEWTFVFPSLRELFMIKEITREVEPKTRKVLVEGMSGGAFMRGLGDFEPKAWAALVYILHKQDGVTLPFNKINLDIANMEVDGVSIADAAEEAARAAAEGDLDEDEGEGEDGDEDDAANPSPPSGPQKRAA